MKRITAIKPNTSAMIPKIRPGEIPFIAIDPKIIARTPRIIFEY